MKLSLPLFVFASIWNSAHGQQESSTVSLRGGATIDASAAAMAMEPSNATTFDIDEFPLVPLIEQDAVAGGEEDEDVQHRRLGLTDWTPCSASYQCNNGCCSGTYSGGVLKCTPLNGGYRSDICVGGGGGSALGDWTQCSASTQCRNGCCSGRYSGGVLKCTPVGGYRADMCVGGGGGGGGASCGNGNRGNGICPNAGECCSQYGWCGTSSDHCGGGGGGGSTGGGSTLLTGSGSGTYYYDITNRMCNGIDTSYMNGAYTTCTGNPPRSLGQYGNNNIVAIGVHLLNAPGGRERYCGKQVRVYRNGAEVPGPFVIWDGCASCGSTKLDFSLTALDRISGGNACQVGNVGGLSWTVTSNQIIPFERW
jgi:hypothetical protein